MRRPLLALATSSSIAISLLASSSPTSLTAGHGTIVVLLASKTRGVVAADSRTIYTDGTTSDETCKIADLGDNFVFSQTNRASMTEISNGRVWWDAPAVALSTAKQLRARWGAVKEGRVQMNGRKPNFGTEFVSSVADMWAAEAVVSFGMIATKVGSAQPIAPSGAMAVQGIFFGLERSGEFSGELRKIFREDSLSPAFRVEARSLTLGKELDCFAFGETAGLEQICGPTKSPALTAKLEAELRGKRNRDVLKATRIAELVRSATPRVGGPIDVAELRIERPLKWHALKPPCRQPAAPPRGF